MYKMTCQTLRPAVAMIELIFALVIMGIVLMFAPMLVSTAMKSSYTSTQQELIAATSTQISMVLSRKWDEANTLGLQKSYVLNTTTGAGLLLNDATGTGFRSGTPTVGEHRTFMDHIGNVFNASPIGVDVGADVGVNAFDDIDDYNGIAVNLGGGGLAGNNNARDDYIDTNIPITTTVQYINATPSEGNYSTASAGLNYNDPFTATKILTSGTSDIKSVQVRLIRNNTQSPELDANITLNAFSCNIGSFQLDSRSL